MKKMLSKIIVMIGILSLVLYGIAKYIRNEQVKKISNTIETTNLIVNGLNTTNCIVYRPKPNQWDRKCPVCKNEDNKSCLIGGWIGTWIKNEYNYIDENGDDERFCYDKVGVYEYKCTRGHEFRIIKYYNGRFTENLEKQTEDKILIGKNDDDDILRIFKFNTNKYTYKIEKGNNISLGNYQIIATTGLR